MLAPKCADETYCFVKQNLRIALLGFGIVGRSFARYLQRSRTDDEKQILIGAVADRSGGLLLRDGDELESILKHKESRLNLREFAPNEVLADAAEFIRILPEMDIPLLVECLPTSPVDGQPALDLIRVALSQGTNVVTVNKGVLVYGFDELQAAARAGPSRFEYSGAIGVRAPEEIGDCHVLEIRGILNGTTNYILTEMQEHALSFQEALTRAQSEGIAEPDPSLDIEGWDTACKILILAKSLMHTGVRPEEVSRIGIGPETAKLIQTARETGRVVRLLGRARFWQGRVRVSVAPKVVGTDSPFYSITGASKAALFRTQEKGETLAVAMSGRHSIAETILEDIRRVTS